jgi:hypothetical protein
VTPALAARARQVRGEQEHRAACAEFRRRRVADEQARIDALLLDVIHALAGAMNAHPANECPECFRALGTRNRTCRHCRPHETAAAA